MRLIAVVLLCVLSTATSACAQNADPEGFSICSFANSGGKMMQSILGPCQPLTGQTMQRFGLSASQIAVVAALRSLVANPGPDLPPRLASELLAEPRPFAAVGAFTDYWLPDATNPGNSELGVHLHYVMEERPQLFQMTYAVDGGEGHFSVLWNRALARSRR